MSNALITTYTILCDTSLTFTTPHATNSALQLKSFTVAQIGGHFCCMSYAACFSCD